jgi:hypothetical protein
MRRIGRSAALIVLAAAGACSSIASQAPSGVVREVGDVIVTSNLQSAGQTTGVSGTVRVVDLPATSDMQIQVEANGLPPGGHAWHIHTGTCQQPGGIVVPFTPVGQREGLDEPITADANGRATEDAPIPGSMLTQETLAATPHVVNIHANPGASPGGAVACAPLQ